MIPVSRTPAKTGTKAAPVIKATPDPAIEEAASPKIVGPAIYMESSSLAMLL
jgi:hypothetical protein